MNGSTDRTAATDDAVGLTRARQRAGPPDALTCTSPSSSCNTAFFPLPNHCNSTLSGHMCNAIWIGNLEQKGGWEWCCAELAGRAPRGTALDGRTHLQACWQRLSALPATLQCQKAASKLPDPPCKAAPAAPAEQRQAWRRCLVPSWPPSCWRPCSSRLPGALGGSQAPGCGAIDGTFAKLASEALWPPAATQPAAPPPPPRAARRAPPCPAPCWLSMPRRAWRAWAWQAATE